MINASRYPKNPILIPNPKNPWEANAVFNGSVAKKDKTFTMVYRAMSRKKIHNGIEMELSVIGKAESSNGIDFDNRKIFITPDRDFDKFGCEDPRITFIDNKYYIFYTALSEFPFNAHGIKVGLAISETLEKIDEKHLITPFNAKAMTLLPEKINGKYAAVLAVNTDMPPAKIAIAYFDNLSDMWNNSYWEDWYKNIDEHTIPLLWSNMDQVEVGATPIKTPYGWLTIFCNIRDYFSSRRLIQVKAVLLDINDPQKVIGIVKNSLLVPEEKYETKGNVPDTIFPTGAILNEDRDELMIYYSGADTNICLATIGLNELWEHMQINNTVPIKMERIKNTPILTPNGEHDWEANAVLNPAAIKIDNKIYLIYRAIGRDGVSRFGLATSTDGINFDERLPDPIYSPREDFEKSGCEDPRVTLLDDKLYFSYTAYKGGDNVRVALTSINLKDFIERNWNWEKPMLASAPQIYDKDACLLPEKINDKYIFFHRITPGISIDKINDLSFGDKKWLKIQSYIVPRPNTWDDEKIGIGPTPTKTQAGWLLIYHGISKIDHQYRAGAMLLDLKDPQVVTGRTKYPILEPDLDWEKDNGRRIVFPCGEVEMDGNLYVYYGAGDKNIGAAKINIHEITDYLVNQSNKKFLEFKR